MTIFSWKKKYEKINNEIKRSRPSQKLEDIQIGTQLYEDLCKNQYFDPLIKTYMLRNSQIS